MPSIQILNALESIICIGFRMVDSSRKARLGTEYDRLMAEFRGEIPTVAKPSTRPWHRVASSTPIPYLWKSSLPYNWQEINTRPVKQVTAPTGKKRDTLEFLTEKQKLINQISMSPLDKLSDKNYCFTQMANSVTKVPISLRKISLDSAFDSAPASASFKGIQGDHLTPEPADPKRRHQRSASVGKLLDKKLFFAFSPVPGKTWNPSVQKNRGMSTLTSSRSSFVTPIPEERIETGKRAEAEKFVITKYSLPTGLVAIHKEAGIKLDSGRLRNKEIDLFLNRFQSKERYQVKPEKRTGFSGCKFTTRKPSNFLRKTNKNQPSFRLKSPSPPHQLAEIEVYLRFLKFKKGKIPSQGNFSSSPAPQNRAKSSLC